MLRKLFKLRSILIVGSSIAAYLPIVAGIIEPMIWSLLLASPLLYHLPKRAHVYVCGCTGVCEYERKRLKFNPIDNFLRFDSVFSSPKALKLRRKNGFIRVTFQRIV